MVESIAEKTEFLLDMSKFESISIITDFPISCTCSHGTIWKLAKIHHGKISFSYLKGFIWVLTKIKDSYLCHCLPRCLSVGIQQYEERKIIKKLGFRR